MGPFLQAGRGELQEFVAFLADHNVVTLTMVCHDLHLDPGNLSPRSCPAWSSIDWQKGESKNGMLKLYMKLTYEDTNQGKGIFPAKPVWILAEARRVEKGKCYLVVPAPGNPKD